MGKENFLMKIYILQIYNRTPIILKIIIFILLTWSIQTLFLYPAVHWGMNWDDWRWLFYFDSHQGSNLSNFFAIKNDLNNIHPLQQTYYLGFLKSIFGLNLTIFQLIALLFKSIAALSIGFVLFKLTKDKIFSFFAIFCFIIFPSTAGLLDVLTALNNLVAFFMIFSIYFYIQSVKQEKKIYLASLFFFLALCAGPARAYPLLPIPLVIELVRLRKSFRLFIFLKRLIIFYLPLILLRSYPGAFTPTYEISVRLRQLSSGNLYTLTLPFQELSTLFIDQHILQDILNFGRLLIPVGNTDVIGFFVMNFVLFILTLFLGFTFNAKQRVWYFVLKVMTPTLIIGIIFYIFGQLSMRNGKIAFNDFEGNTYWLAPFNPTIYQALIGVYITVLGFILSLEWWRSKEYNNLHRIISMSWFWAVSSIFLLYITNYRYEMIVESNDRYTYVNSIGAVIFVAGIFTLCIKSFRRIKNLNLKILFMFLFIFFIFVLTYKDYKYLNKYYADYNNHSGDSMRYVKASFQDSMYQKFLAKFGKENLVKPAILYIDSEDNAFNKAAFSEPIVYRIYYDENTNLIRNNCKVIITDIKILQKAYTVYNGERGFIYDTPCVDPEFGVKPQTVFYPLGSFYAYKIENKQFIDIKDEIIKLLNQINK